MVTIGSVHLDVENVPEIPTILGHAFELITVKAPSTTTQLVHFTLHEYLSGNKQSLFRIPHLIITELFLKCHNFRWLRTSAHSRLHPASIPACRICVLLLGRAHVKGESGKREPNCTWPWLDLKSLYPLG